jgi:OMF family outer membrane factor
MFITLAHRYMIVVSINFILVLRSIGSSVAQVPDDLNPSPNPLQLPSLPIEVTIQGTQPITLQQALALARQNNSELKFALYQVQRSRAALKEVQSGMYPTVTLNADLSRAQSAFSQLSAEQLQAQLSLTQNVTAGQDESNTTFSGTVQLIYGLYNYGPGSSSRGVAKEQISLDELDVKRVSEEIRLNVTLDYYNLQQADEQVRIAQSSVENSEASLRDAIALERAGVGTRFDVLRSEVNLANAQQDLTNAFSQQQIARRRLATRLNLAQFANISAADPVKLAGLWQHTLEQTIISAFQNRPELPQRLAERNVARFRQKIAISRLKPQISLVADYELEDVLNDGIGVSNGNSLGVKSTLRLLDGGTAKAQVSQQSIEAKIAETQFANQLHNIRFEVEQAYFQLESNLENVQTANVALEQAKEALRLGRLRFQAGVGTQTDVINALNDLIKAEGKRVQAILDYNRALSQLQRAVTARGVYSASPTYFK